MKVELSEYLKLYNKSYYNKKHQKDEFECFIKNLKNTYLLLLEAKKNNKSEENIKNITVNFLRDTFYKNRKDIQLLPECKVDSAITKSNNIEVILEFKKTSNTNEMISINDINKKALHETIKYFYDERYNNNYYIKNIIISNSIEYFIFDSKQFINKGFEKIYKELSLNKNSTNDIYSALKGYIKDNNIEFNYTYFNLEKYEINNIEENIDYSSKNIKELLHIYKILHPDYLLKEYSAKDSNQLNKKFYDELLHILGLKEEIVNGSIKIISNKESNSLLNKTIQKLRDDKDIFNPEEQFDIAFELVITWLNRILFLKLFESQLVSFNNNDKNFKFITSDNITDFDKLNNLFFDILGKKVEERDIDKKYTNIPYLNSSLFEKINYEKKYILVSSLNNDIEIPLYTSSILKNNAKYNKLKTVKLLDYLLDFLDSYDFTSNYGSDELVVSNKNDVINSAVLGLIFEKLNGYKDGSVYTPGFITEYIAKEVIEKSVIDIFNNKYNIMCHDIEELKNFISVNLYKKEKLKEYNDIINSLKILDPAVGSGHFLVSVLNEIIALKSYLGILCDNKYIRLTNKIDIIDDTLVIYNQDDTIYRYSRFNSQTWDLQKIIFNEKRTIIENCLFAVDINQKSVYICWLRLWIELLKNTFYIDNSNDMETLPNIDINIKTGNALINKYPIKVGKAITQQGSKEQKDNIKKYKDLVSKYKRSGSKSDKLNVQNQLNEIKSKLYSVVNDALIIETKEQKEQNKKIQDLKKKQKLAKTIQERRQINDEISKLEKTGSFLFLGDSIDNSMYKNSIEWALEFPEVLDDEGKFQGFDIVIGNPPYIQLQKNKDESGNYNIYTVYDKKGDIYCLFYERGLSLLKTNGFLGYITSNKWMRAEYGLKLRKYLIKYNPVLLFDLGANIFDSATVDTNILVIQNKSYEKKTLSCILPNRSEKMSDFIKQEGINIEYNEDSWIILNQIEKSIKDKIEKYGTPLKDWDISINYGVKTGCNKAFIIDGATKDELIKQDPKSDEIIRPILRGRDIKRYSYNFADKWLINIECGFTNKNRNNIPPEEFIKTKYPAIYNHLLSVANQKTKGKGLINRDDKGDYWWELRSCAYMDDFNKQKIIYQELSQGSCFALDIKGEFTISNTAYLITGNNLDYLIILLNSKFIEYCFKTFYSITIGDKGIRWLNQYIIKLPIIILSEKDKNNILKSDNNKIEEIIHNLYHLTEEEIQYIETLL